MQAHLHASIQPPFSQLEIRPRILILLAQPVTGGQI